MKKKTQPKPTKISKHNAGYSFQIKSSNLAPLPTNVQNVRSYNPQQSLESQATFMSSTVGPGRKAPLGRAVGTSNTMQQALSAPSDNGSFSSGHYGYSEEGLSTDGFEVYEQPNNNHIDHHLQHMAHANLNREKNVRSAPASIPGSAATSHHGVVHFNSVLNGGESTELGESVSLTEGIDELEWMFHVIIEPPPVSVRKPSAPKSRPGSSIPRAPTTPTPVPTLHYDSFLLHLVDKDLHHATDYTFNEPDQHPTYENNNTTNYNITNNTTNYNNTTNTNNDNIQLTPYYEEDEYSEDGFGIESDYWSQSQKKSNKHTSSKHFAKSSVLALLDDTLHNTTMIHTNNASNEFFNTVSKKMIDVGLVEMADKLVPRSRKAQFTQFPNSEILTFSDDSRPDSPDGKYNSRTGGVGSGEGGTSGGVVDGGEGEYVVDWENAFESDFEDIQFDTHKVTKSKSHDVHTERSDNTTRVIVSASSKLSNNNTNSSNNTNNSYKPKSRPGTADTITLEEIMEGVVDIEEESHNTPFKSLKTGRRRSFSDFAESPTSPSGKMKSVKYFSYLNMNQPSQKVTKFKTAGSGDDELDRALQISKNNSSLIIHVSDPFQGVRPERRNSTPLLSPTHRLSSDSTEEKKGIPTMRPIEIEPARPFSNPTNEGPVWGLIPNYSRKQDYVQTQQTLMSHKTSFHSSPVARAHTILPTVRRPQSAQHVQNGPVIVGYVKKFQFEGESIKSPFLHHMTKDKHVKKYGDDQRAERAAKLHPSSSTPTHNNSSNNKNSSNSIKYKESKTVGSMSTGSLVDTYKTIETPKPEPVNFDTTVVKPKNPFLRQNSWEKDPTQPYFNTNIPHSRKPFGNNSIYEENTTNSNTTNTSMLFKNNKNVLQEGLDSYSWDDSHDSFGDDHSHHSHQSSDGGNGIGGIGGGSGMGGTGGGGMFSSVKNRAILSRQNSLTRDAGRDRPGVLSRQTSSVDRPGVLSRQNSITSALPPISVGSGKGGVNDMQALINSINSVLIAPKPLKHNRPTDVFGRGSGGGGGGNGGGENSNTASHTGSHSNSILSSQNDSERNGPRGMLSRGNSFVNTNSSAFSMSRGNSFRDGATTQSPPVPQRQTPWNRAIGSPGAYQGSIGEDEEYRPESRPMEYNSMSFVPGPLAPLTLAPPGSPTALSETMQKYVPSERRGSLLGEVESVSDVIQRRRSSVALLNGPAPSDIDKLVSARRDSFVARPQSQSPQLGQVSQASVHNESLPRNVASSAIQRNTSDSLDSNFLNPLMEEYYDHEEGLQDTGVIIANLHADPLYRILREEIERQQHEERMFRTVHTQHTTAHTTTHTTHSTHSVHTNHTHTSNHSTHNSVHSHQIKASTKPTVRPTRSANGMSNYKTRQLGNTIIPSDLKVLSTFHSLPPAAWVTCRVVYFLLLSFYECVTRVGKHYEYRNVLKAEALWKVLENHISERHMCMEEVDYQYSWPVLQHLFARFPVVITRVLHAIEHGVVEDDTQSVPEFPSSVFFDSFPPTKLIYLRDLIKQCMGLFQASELVHMIPVAAQLCNWSKRVIAQVYQSCITRLRATQQHTLKGTSVLHSTVPVYNPSDDATFDSQYENDERPATLPPNFKFVLAVEDALEESALFAMQSQDSFSGADGSLYPLLGLSHTLEKGLNLVKPSDRLDLLLVPPTLRDIHTQLSMYNSVSVSNELNDPFSSVVSQTGDSLSRLQNDWLVTKHMYERHLQQYAASPLHQVILLPPPHSLYTTSNLYSDTSQVEYDLQSRLDDFIQAQVSPSHLHASQSLPRSVVFNLRSKGVHPILEHSVTAAAAIGGVTLNTHKHTHESTQTDVLITRMRDGKLPSFIQGNVLTAAGSLKIAEHESLALRFSLVLIDDAAPLQRRPLSPFSSSFPTFVLNKSIDQAVASTVGPNKYVVCIADTPNSWLSFQMICRMVRPSDSITLIHIPVITPPFGSKVHSSSTEESVYVTRRQYLHQRAKCQHRIEHLIQVYKSVGYNLYVDKIPTYREEMARQLAYMQRKNYFQAQLMTTQYNTTSWNNTTKSMKHNSSDVTVRLFVQNQHTYHLATRVLTLAQKHDPTFLVLGAEGGDILKVFTNPVDTPSIDINSVHVDSSVHNSVHTSGNAHTNSSVHTSGNAHTNSSTNSSVHTRETVLVSGECIQGTKNLNFPHNEVVLNNVRDPEELNVLLSNKSIDDTQSVHWLNQFKLYSDQRIDLVEMILHQYSSQCITQTHTESLKAFGFDPHKPETEGETKRFSFIVSNSDCLK